MIELIAGLIIGASITILALHFARRLKPLQAAETAYTGGISATSVDITGRDNAAGIDPFYARKLRDVLNIQDAG